MPKRRVRRFISQRCRLKAFPRFLVGLVLIALIAVFLSSRSAFLQGPPPTLADDFNDN